MSDEKIIITPYELQTMLGMTDPCLSDRLKNALDEETSKPRYQDLSHNDASLLAMRVLALENPDAYDPENKDDVAAKRLAVILINEDGSTASAEELAERVEPGVIADIPDDGDQNDSDQEDQPKKTKKKKRPKPFPGTGKLTNKQIERGLMLLKSEVIDSEDFSDVVDFFLSEYGENPRFGILGKPITSVPGLEFALQEVAKKIFPDEKCEVEQFIATQLEKHRFIHGGGMVNNRPAIAFAFEDCGIGMAAISEFDGNTHYMRISMAVQEK